METHFNSSPSPSVQHRIVKAASSTTTTPEISPVCDFMKRSLSLEGGVRLPPKSTPSNSAKFLMLFNLPHEVRERIFYNALSAVQPIAWPTEHSQHHLCPALLLTCRRVYEEAAPILYRFNRFAFSHPSDSNVFYWIMDQNQVRKICHVAFRIREKDWMLWNSYLSSTDSCRSFQHNWPNLKRLWIVMKSTSWNHTRDAEQNLSEWANNSKLRQLCMALEHRTRAEIEILYCLKIPDGHFDRLSETRASFFVKAGAGFLRTNVMTVFSSKVVLEMTPYHTGRVENGGQFLPAFDFH